MMAPNCYLTRVETFSACHRLHSSSLSESVNRVVYGKCNNPNGHGHNYRLEVTLSGPSDSTTGMLMNISALKSVIQEEVLELVDHKNLDEDVEYFKANSIVSTTENLVIFIWNQLIAKIPRNMLYEVKLWETDKNCVTYRGELVQNE
ncbi:unnamed protein product [Calicophoron daubneyi]|uniref:6-pyruvoyl tetrahydrobiopterin synthase n=1 Tax=Calicophoron daubneyi TaxID=300641 RepID=A0AAV2TMX3_CALDB